jgi:hypothetical protein
VLTVARAVDHRQAEDRPGQARIAEDDPFDEDLVVVVHQPLRVVRRPRLISPV